ncbi:MAG: hypothetical protein O3A41_04235 [Bacteroidetes bacterium]|nr:hypothetical protein [Bacteroidota bacterium]
MKITQSTPMKLTPDGNVPLKTKPTDPAKSNTQGQKAVQIKKKPFKGVF